MAENTNVNKVVYGNDTLIDLTQDTVEPSNLLEGETAHNRSGAGITGTAKQGHIVQNNSGTDMTQRSKLQFVGVYTEDDNTNNRTKVDIVREMTKEQMDALSSNEKKGFIRTTNEPDAPYSAISNAEVNFTEASTRTNIASGESISTLFGKIKKFFTDLKAVAFSGSASDVVMSDGVTSVEDAISNTNVALNGLNSTTPKIKTEYIESMTFQIYNGHLQLIYIPVGGTRITINLN